MIEQHEVNKQWWNDVTPAHVRSAMYDVEGFVRGRVALDPIELAAFGDVSGKSLLHLQCHFGLSTLEWARRGARVTGVDFSDVAIDKACEISERISLSDKATFILSDVLELHDKLDQTFDLVFTSYGAINWLSDLQKWGRVVAAALKPGGTFFIADVHPVANMFEEKDGRREQIVDYFNHADGLDSEPNRWPDYADPSYIGKFGTREWQWTISDVIESLLTAGLTITSLKEYDTCCFQMFPRLVQRTRDFWCFPANELRIPMTFAITARK